MCKPYVIFNSKTYPRNSWKEMERIEKQVAFQSNANHALAESMGYIKSEGV